MGVLVFVPTCGLCGTPWETAAVGGGAAGVDVVVVPVMLGGLTGTFWWYSHASVSPTEVSRVAASSETICIRLRLLRRDWVSSTPSSFVGAWCAPASAVAP